MLDGQRRAPDRLWAALLASLLAVVGALTFASPASADPASGRLVADAQGHAVLKAGTAGAVNLVGEREGTPTGLFEFKLDGTGQELLTYCIDLGTRTDTKVRYDEVSWDNSGRPEADVRSINWILRNSYPSVALEQLAAAIHVDVGQLGVKDAVAGTQAAIWHFSDGAKLNLDHPGRGSGQVVKALYSYLTGPANTGEGEPTVTLDIAPAAQSGHDGDTIGPFTVSTTASSVAVKLRDGVADGVDVVDEDGHKVTAAKDGDKLYVSVPSGAAAGRAIIDGDAQASVAVGRIFKGEKKSQTMIVASSQPTTVHAEAVAEWSEAPLPAPGASAKLSCAEGGLEVTLTNTGEASGTFTVEGKDYTVEAGESQTVLVPVEEDTDYSVTVTGPGGFSKTFPSHRDCEQSSPTPTPTPTPTSSPAQAAPVSSSGGLAHTGADNLPMQIGLALALLVLGGMLMFVVRRRIRQPRP